MNKTHKLRYASYISFTMNTVLNKRTSGNKAAVAYQSSMLACKEKDWKLPGTVVVNTRTRNGGTGRPNMSIRKKMFNESESESEDDDSEANEELIEIAGPPIEEIDKDDTSTVEEEDDDLTPKEGGKPPHTRAIFELEGLMETLSMHCRCPQCGGQLKPSTKSTCLATKLKLTCTKACGYIHYIKAPAEASIGNIGAPSRDRSTDYAINVLFVLAFVTMGDGCTEAARLLALLGLPNAYTMESRSFTIIEERLSCWRKQHKD
jgi:hypothetical protein